MRIKTKQGKKNAPQISPNAIKRFFNKRAEKANKIGYLKAVIYQENNSNLAELRDVAEKALLLPKLKPLSTCRVLDIGCGPGRWASILSSEAQYYHGIDFTERFIQFARKAYAFSKKTRFSNMRSVDVSLKSLGEVLKFDRIVIFGLLIYLNEMDAIKTLRGVAKVAAPMCRILIREPVALGKRLTLKNHFSTEMNQQYNAIYRTENELKNIIFKTLIKK